MKFEKIDVTKANVNLRLIVESENLKSASVDINLL